MNPHASPPEANLHALPAFRSGALVLLGLLVVLHALPYAFSTIILDTARDLNIAWRIGQFGELPLRGPVINDMAHLGPGWFYLLSLPLWASGSLALTLGFVGLLAGLKFPLAYFLGSKLHSPTFGILWALMLAMPSWALAGSILVTHTSVVETTVLLTACMAWWAGQSDRHLPFALLGLSITATLHAHPATLALAPLLLFLPWRRRSLPWRCELPRYLLAVAMAALPFLPMLIAEARDGWPMLHGLERYATERTAATGIGKLLVGVFSGGAIMLGEQIGSADARWPLRILMSMVLTGALAGIVAGARDPDLRRLSLGFATVSALAVAGLMAIRELTPFYMALVATPPAAGLLATGLAGWQATRLGRGIVMVCGCAALLLASAGSWILIARAEQGQMSLASAAFGDVRRFDAPHEEVALLPAWRLDQFGRRSCDHDGTIVLHSDLALLVDSALALSAKLQCGHADHIAIGGGSGVPIERHRLGLTPRVMRRLGIAADADWTDTFELRPHRVVAAQSSLTVPDGSLYPFRVRGLGEPLLHWTFAAEPSRLILVNHLHRVYDGAKTVHVSANGQTVEPLLATFGVEAYRCAYCSDPVHWRIEVANAHRDRADILVH